MSYSTHPKLKKFPPHLVEGDDLISKLRRFHFIHGETIKILLIVILSLSYMILLG